MKDAKARQERDVAAADKWQAEEAAKQDAQIAAALARQQRIQSDLEQARLRIAYCVWCIYGQHMMHHHYDCMPCCL